MRRWIPLAALLALAACEPATFGDAAGPSVGAQSDAIRNGTREPQVLPLTEGQKLAIGWLHPRGQPGDNFCTGTLITPNLVATAAHCTRGRSARSLSFGVGLDPSDPTATFAAAAKFEHARLDICIIQITEDATDRVPELVPIAANRAALDDSLLGREVEAAGYGETYDRSRSGRYFAVVELIRVQATEFTVDGRGQQGICFGDSGGPVMTTDADDQPMVLGVENWGDQSCVGQDHLARLDVVADWIDEIAAGGDPGACGDVDYLGRCTGSVAEWCDGGSIQRLDCNDRGQTCGFVDENVGYFCQDAPPCGDVPSTGLCEGDQVVRCRFGRLAYEDCTTRDQECAQDAGGAFCRAPPVVEPERDASAPDADPEPDAGLPEADARPDPAPPVPDAAVDPGLDSDGGRDTLLDDERSRSDGGCQAAPGRAAGAAGLSIFAFFAFFLLTGLIPRRDRP